VPPWPSRRIPVAVPGGHRTGRDLPLDRLAVGATRTGLHLVGLDDGRPVHPIVFDLLRTEVAAPATVWFLRELAREGVRAMRPWSWGPVAAAPFLPRVRLGRTILAPATWRVAGSALAAAAHTGDGWAEAVERWRKDAGVPVTVLLGDHDRRLPLDLDDEAHRRILRQEVRRGATAVTEVPGGEDAHDGWLRGPDGPHACEVVVPLVRVRPGPPVVPTRSRLRSGDHATRPGGPWLYARLPCPPERQDDLLRERFPDLVRRLRAAVPVERWFFLRYADPQPHLRVRVKAAPAPLWSAGLAVLHAWAGELAADGYDGRFTLDGYDPELERFGGVAATTAAECVFEADSEVALALLADPAAGPVEAAASVVDLLLPLGGPDALLRRLARWGSPPEQRAAYRALPASVRRGLEEDPAGHDPVRAERRAAVDRYWALAVTDRPADTIALTLAHLHCNRVAGIGRAREHAILGLAWNAVRTRSGRDRHRRS
jgi:lantibiotic biosynthesis protein